MFKHTTPIPSDDELKEMHEAPAKTLHPSLPADKFYHLVLKEKLWRSWSGDSFGVHYFADLKEDAGPFEVDVKGKSISFRDKMIVQDSQTSVPVAVILRMHLKWETTFKIYGLVPYLDQQVPSKDQKHDGKDLYEWASCTDKFFSVRKTLTMVDGASYVMDGVGYAISKFRQLRVARNGVPCLYAGEQTLGIFTGNQWEVKIAPGIDPALMIAFMAVMDEMNEQ